MDTEQWLQECVLVESSNLKMLRDFLGDDAFGVFEDFIADATNHVSELQDSSLEHDRLTAISHTLKSSAANVGAMRLALLAKEVERLSRAGEGEEAKSLLPLMPALWADSVVQIRKEIEALRA